MKTNPPSTPIKTPPRKPRSKAFFGLHFDFHANEKTNQIGSRPFSKHLEEMLRRVQPDYVQCDCKGHPGFSSYPTKIAYPAPGIKSDTLKVWRRVTAKHGVSLYMHYSGVFDKEALKHHPSWGLLDPKGKMIGENTSVFGPYVDELMIPQLQELRDDYGVDGYWIDGECWATCQDYGILPRKAFRALTGIAKLPKKPEDPHFFEFTEFCREGFRNYLRHYVDRIHALCPGVEVASNWAFSSFMPEPVSASVDFLSGDYSMNDSVNSARLEARCLMHQGKAWDLMAWAFCSTWEDQCRTSKSALQLQREAAMVLSLGGGFQMYFVQRTDGSFKEHEIPVMESVARFCRERERFCHGATSIPQAAVLYSSTSYYRKSRRIFGPWDGQLNAMHGVMNALLHNQMPTDIVSEHHLDTDINRFPLIVIPEWEDLERSFRVKLLDYVRKGGRLLLIGPAPIKLFRRELGVKISRAAEDAGRWLSAGGYFAGIQGSGIRISPEKGTRTLALWHESNDPTSPSHAAATIRPLGDGMIGALCMEIGRHYKEKATAQLRAVFGCLLQEFFPAPLVEVLGSHLVDVTLMRKDGNLFVHLVNTGGPHDNLRYYTHDEIVPIGPLKIRLRLTLKPKSITLQPEGTPLPFQWKNGEALVDLDKLTIHSILQVEGVQPD